LCEPSAVAPSPVRRLRQARLGAKPATALHSLRPPSPRAPGRRMRTKLLPIGVAVTGLLTAIIAALAVWRRAERDATTSAIRAIPAGTQTGVDEAREVAAGGPALPPDLEPHPTGAFAALGRFDYRFRRVLPVIGLGIMVALQAWASQAGGT